MIKLSREQLPAGLFSLLHVFHYNISKTMANHKSTTEKQRMRSFGLISDPRSLGLKCIKVADESTLLL